MRKGIGNEFNKLFDTLNATTFGKSQKRMLRSNSVHINFSKLLKDKRLCAYHVQTRKPNQRDR